MNTLREVVADALPELLTLADRPQGVGLGECPNLRYPQDRSIAKQCACAAPRCVICGHRKHVALHLHCYGEKPGDPPFDHEYVPANKEPK